MQSLYNPSSIYIVLIEKYYRFFVSQNDTYFMPSLKKTYFYWLTLLSFAPCRSPLCFCSIRHISPRHVAAEVLCQGIVDVHSPSALPYIEPSDDECASALACPPSVMLTAVTAAHMWTDINHES